MTIGLAPIAGMLVNWMIDYDVDRLEIASRLRQLIYGDTGTGKFPAQSIGEIDRTRVPINYTQ